MSDAPPTGYRVTTYFVCHECKTAGVVEVDTPGPTPPTPAEAERLAFAAAEARVVRADPDAAGARIDLQNVTVRPQRIET